ncbi:hypothetical protein ABTK45_19995, partial [Acinetobacter baumannii]
VKVVRRQCRARCPEVAQRVGPVAQVLAGAQLRVEPRVCPTPRKIVPITLVRSAVLLELQQIGGVKAHRHAPQRVVELTAHGPVN